MNLTKLNRKFRQNKREVNHNLHYVALVGLHLTSCS